MYTRNAIVRAVLAVVADVGDGERVWRRLHRQSVVDVRVIEKKQEHEREK
jgi:hypothetical protein